MERDPEVFTVDIPKGTFPTLLGVIWMYEENLQMDIKIYREKWIEHLAYAAGINLFWIIIFKMCMMCITKN